MGMLEWILLIALGVLWGGSFFFAKVAVEEVPPLTLVLYRVLLASLALLIFLRIRGVSLPRGTPVWRAFFIMGLLNNVIPFSLLFWGQARLDSGLASILNATMPIFTVLVAHRFTDDEPITRGKLGGVILGFVGVAVMLGGGVGDRMSSPPLAMFAVLGAALSYAFASVYGRTFRGLGVRPTQVAFGQLCASSLLMIPLVLLWDPIPGPGDLSAGVLIAVLALALMSTALAYILYFRILASGGAVNISLVTLLVPVTAILLGAIFLAERLQWHAWAGMGLIGLGLIVMDGRIFRRRPRAV
jgi:drug/metabolite transporter (DMT)-like permease